MVFGNRQHSPDPDDYFSETRMSFGDHLEDLRIHLWRAIAGFCIALVFGFFLGKPVERFIAAPVEEQLQRYWDRYFALKRHEVSIGLRDGTVAQPEPIVIDILVPKQMADVKNRPALDLLPTFRPVMRELGIDSWMADAKIVGNDFVLVKGYITNGIEFAEGLKAIERLIGRRPALATMSVQEGFMVYFQVSIVCGLVLSSPWIFYQIWSFVAAGLYPHEKRHVNVFLPFSLALFLGGVLVCEFVAIPRAVEALLWFNQWMDLEPNFRLNEWLSFAIFMPLVFGVSFQTPLVMLFLERIGVFTIDSFRKARRIAWFVMCLFGAIINPSTDVASLLSLWIPMCFLYELGILLCKFFPRPPEVEFEADELDKLIEV
jgi:sec-independent protein translocase protein TatC